MKIVIAALLLMTTGAYAETISVIVCPPKGPCIREYREVKSSCTIDYERGLPASRACRKAADEELAGINRMIRGLEEDNRRNDERFWQRMRQPLPR